MTERSMRGGIGALSVAVLFSAVTCWPAGFEKVIMWSGEFAGVAGAGTSAVTGAQSLYFNPAGLARGTPTEKGEVSLNFSPTFAKYKGPIVAPGMISDSTRTFSPVFGAVGSYRLSDKVGIGIGSFVSGGTDSLYENVDFGAAFSGLKPTVKSQLQVVEFSAGAAIEPLSGLTAGLAWRAVHVGASLASAQLASPASLGGASILTAVQLEDLSKTRWNGFRAGLQYVSDQAHWGVGANWRSSIRFTARGTGQAQAAIAAGSTTIATGEAASAPVDVSNRFPSQVTLSGYWDIAPGLFRFLAEYAWTDYHANQQLEVSGALPLQGFTGPFAALNGQNVLVPITEHWANMINLRFGTEYRGFSDLVLRAGYAYTSKVTPESNARATFSSPGPASTLTIGAGGPLLSDWEWNGALEYSAASGTVTTEQPMTGKYSTNAYTGHFGITRRF